MMVRPTSVTSQSVKKYYDNNTSIFLSLGTGNKNHSIHRAVWGEGVQNRDEAQAFANKLILDVLITLPYSQNLHVLDLGCGVGSTLFYLIENFTEKAEYTGITISTKQVEIAKKINQHAGFSCQFVAADFLELPEMLPVHFAFSIEAFIHASDARAFFREVSRELQTGGRLVLIDDFLTEKGSSDALSFHQRQWIDDVEKGWMAGTLITPAQAVDMAQAIELSLIENHNLTPFLELRRPRDRFIEILMKLLGKWAYHSTYFRSLRGGDALQKCLLNGLLEYRMLVFEKTK
jgi:cyclopropane fatty-acyl-phospholipid synthase-like methyltransferase